MKPKLVKGYISAKPDDLLTEQFTGEVTDKIIRWPKELGAEHPFEFQDIEGLVKKFGLIDGILDKIVSNTVGDFSVKTENKEALKLLEELIYNNNFAIRIREWFKEGLSKGNGIMEIDSKEGKIQVLNANNMYVARDKKGIVKGWNQYLGDPQKLNVKKINPFKPDQIAHLKINATPGEPYGIGKIWPSERIIENMILIEQDIKKLMSRKAGAPIHVKVGVPGEAVNPTDIDSFKSLLQFMNNRTEWVTDANVEMTVLQFGEIGKNLLEAWRANLLELIAGLDIPEVLLNSGQLNEGIAQVQLEGWSRVIGNYQSMLESIIIEKIFNPYLKQNGITADDIDFVWNLPGNTEVNNRIEKLGALMAQMSLSPNMRRMLELEVAKLLNIQDAENFLPEPEEGLNEQREAENQAAQQMNAPAPPGVRPKAPPFPKPTQKAREMKESLDYGNMKVKEFIDIKEVQGLTYSDYMVAILKRIRNDEFTDLRAITEIDQSNGLLSDNEISKLRTILKEGFRRNQSINEIQNNIKDSINLKDRIKEDGGIIPKESRPEMIARTEVVRLSNEGLKDLYQDNGIKNVMWAASLSDRTCELCQAMDGQIYPITEAHGDKIPPLHSNCRCVLIAT